MKSILLRIDEKKAEALRVMANLEKRTLNAEINHLLDFALRARGNLLKKEVGNDSPHLGADLDSTRSQDIVTIMEYQEKNKSYIEKQLEIIKRTWIDGK